MLPIDASAQLDPAARRDLIRQFEGKNRDAQAKKKEPDVQLEPTKQEGLETLRQEMTDTRTEFLSQRSSENRARAAQATINYVDPLRLLGLREEAAVHLDLAIQLLGGEKTLSQLLFQIRTEQGYEALEGEDLFSARKFLEKARSAALGGGDRAAISDADENLRGFYFAWGDRLYWEGDWQGAREQADQALRFGIDTQPIQGFLAKISYQRDDYRRAETELSAALTGEYRKDPSLLQIAGLVRKEKTLEWNYRKHELDKIVVSVPTGLVVNTKVLAAVLAEAREHTANAFGIRVPWPVRVSVYQRADFLEFCEAPDWSAVVSSGGKLRFRADAIRGGQLALRVIARYAYGLWLADVWSDGKAPAWFREGFAHQLAFPTGPPNGGINEIKRLLSGQNAMQLGQLEYPFTQFAERRDAATQMAQSQSVFQWLLEKRGLEVPRELLERFRYSPTAEAALREYTGFTYTSLLSEWGASMQRGFLTDPNPDVSTLRSLGIVSPMGSYWEQ